MDVEIRYFKRSVLLVLTGRIDYSNVQEMEDAIDQVLEEGCKNVVADLSGVEFMCSRGIRALFSGWDHCSKKGGAFRLSNPSPQMVIELEIAGGDSVFEIYDSEISAVASF